MDLVSRLPDELLCHIVSFLPTKNAALTSVLSKRWLNVWKLVPNLHIDDSVFLHPEAGKRDREDIQESFIQFVDGVLAMQGQTPIKSFSLKCISSVHPDTVYRWICNVLQRGVSDLDLRTNFSLENLYVLPEEMFFSSTLAKLKLRSESYLYWDKSSLPMLKSLDIGSALILFSGLFEEIIPCFPVLEELRIDNMEWDEFDVTVSSASLRKLGLNCSGCRGFVNPRSVSFDTPNLVSLEYYDLVAEDYPLVNMGKLLEAVIYLMITDDQVKRVREPNNDLLGADDEVLKFGNVVKLFRGIRNVQKLNLPSDTLEVLSLCTESLPVFNNLKSLGVLSVEGRGWQAMHALLRNCPHLKTITMEGLLHPVTDKCGDACPCIAQGDKGRSLRSCPVNRLEIRGFQGAMKEMAMIQHFLAYFPCLKRLDVFIEDIFPRQISSPQVQRRIKEMFEQYNKLAPSCSLQLR